MLVSLPRQKSPTDCDISINRKLGIFYPYFDIQINLSIGSLTRETSAESWLQILFCMYLLAYLSIHEGTSEKSERHNLLQIYYSLDGAVEEVKLYYHLISSVFSLGGRRHQL